MKDFKGARVLITGASGGIKEAFARELAQKGAHLVLVARSEDKLETLARELSGQYGIEADALPADLTQPSAFVAIENYIAQKGPIDVLINNAGFGSYGKFVDNDPTKEIQEVELNVLAVVRLAKMILPGMLERQKGALINVASIVGFQPIPKMAIYSATKSFVLTFSEALWHECKDSGVQVMALCPGPVDTGFFEAMGSRAIPMIEFADKPESVVKEALKALAKGKPRIIPRFVDSLGPTLAKMLPRTLAVRSVGLLMRSRKGI